MKRVRWVLLAICLIIVFVVAGIGSFFTDTKSGWYDAIKPEITPPNWVFPIVWTILFILIALSLYFSYEEAKDKNLIILAYGVNFFINISWSIIFFTLKNPAIAFINLILLLISIIMLILMNYKIDKKAAYLLVPYSVWVAFAGIINYLSI